VSEVFGGERLDLDYHDSNVSITGFSRSSLPALNGRRHDAYHNVFPPRAAVGAGKRTIAAQCHKCQINIVGSVAKRETGHARIACPDAGVNQ
jgi:hypothetical protein